MSPRRHTPASRFAEKINEYIAFMQGLGRSFRVEGCCLRSFDAFCLRKGYDGPLTQAVALEYVYATTGVRTIQYAKRYRWLRDFATYLAAFEPETEVIDPHAIAVKPERCLAHIYTEEELRRLLHAVCDLRGMDSFRVATYQTVLGLLASTGLRVREALWLDLEDVDLRAGTLHIRTSKFRKSRIVAVHPTTCEALRRHRAMRDAHCPDPGQHAFFLNRKRRRLGYTTIQALFLKVARTIGIRDTEGRGPRLHDLRHTFAVRRVLAWYDAGEDVQAKLPLLATHMGHAHFDDTVYYLTSASELLARGAERFTNHRSHSHAQPTE